jgi:hypothetical protein
MKPLRVVIAGGGTGGHLDPGIAVARELLRRSPQSVVTFAGTSRGIESRVLPREGFELDVLRSAGFKGTSAAAALRSLALLPLGGLDAWRIVSQRSPDLVIGVGGYSSGPVVAVASLRRIPTLLLEQNAVPGMTNRILARYVRAAAVTFESTVTYFGRRGFVAGNPVRPEFLETGGAPAQRSAGPTRILIFGGSQGAHAINPWWIAPRLEVPWPGGNHASDRRTRSRTRPRRLSARGARSPGGAVPLRHGPGNKGRRPGDLSRRRGRDRRARGGGTAGGVRSAADGRRRPAAQRGGSRRGGRGGDDRAEGPHRRALADRMLALAEAAATREDVGWQRGAWRTPTRPA